MNFCSFLFSDPHQILNHDYSVRSVKLFPRPVCVHSFEQFVRQIVSCGRRKKSSPFSLCAAGVQVESRNVVTIFQQAFQFGLPIFGYGSERLERFKQKCRLTFQQTRLVGRYDLITSSLTRYKDIFFASKIVLLALNRRTRPLSKIRTLMFVTLTKTWRVFEQRSCGIDSQQSESLMI